MTLKLPLSAHSVVLYNPELQSKLINDIVQYRQSQDKSDAYIVSLSAELANTMKALANIMRAIEAGIFSEMTQIRLRELEDKKKTLFVRY